MNTDTIERIRRSLKDPHVGPETVALMMTRICNLDCLYCRGGHPDHGGTVRPEWGKELTTAEWFKFFEDAKDFQVKEINLGGLVGDPFCKKDILAILRKIKELGFMGSMTTNGSLLDPEAAKVITECGWDIMLLSLDAITPEIQHKVRPAIDQRPYFHRITGFFEDLERLDSKLRVLLNVVITRHNYKTLPDILNFARAHKNIESVHVLKMLYSGQKDYGLLQLDEAEREEFKNMLRAHAGDKKLAYAGNWLDEDKVPETALMGGSPQPACDNPGQCFTNYYILSVDANGDILQCPQIQDPVAGMNVKKIRLKKLWTGEHLKFRRRLKAKAPCFEGCCTILKEQNKMIYKAVAGSGED
jgi:MoaA/NifB/PqqE/SkfB family radical SAM enzyme